MLKPADIIQRKGGPQAFARKIKRSEGAVRVWKHRNSFPRDAWPDIVRAFPDLTLNRLLRIEREGKNTAA